MRLSFFPIGIIIRQFSAKPLRSKKNRSLTEYAKKFVDFKKVDCRAGSGGSGMLAFLRIFCNPKAGPSGGDGGNGGHVIFRASTNINSLEEVPSIVKGENGESGQSKDCHGASAKHTYVDVPVGSVFRNQDDVVVADLSFNGAWFVAVHGGAGGKGNHFFLTNENRHPRIAEVGGVGEVKKYNVELRVLAHAGLIGFPNVGKSTLLRAISRAKPKVAAYPFTTLNPHVGMVQYDDYEQIAVADLPGLVPGSHKDKGLGFGFLKHVERCLCLLYVIDLAEEQPWKQLEHLQHELEMYKTGLSQRPHAIIGNKIDLPESEKNLEVLRSKINLPVFGISAKYGNDVVHLLNHLKNIYDENIKKNDEDAK